MSFWLISSGALVTVCFDARNLTVLLYLDILFHQRGSIFEFQSETVTMALVSVKDRREGVGLVDLKLYNYLARQANPFLHSQNDCAM